MDVVADVLQFYYLPLTNNNNIYAFSKSLCLSRMTTKFEAENRRKFTSKWIA